MVGDLGDRTKQDWVAGEVSATVFRKLRSHDDTPLAALDRDDLVLDGVIAADEDEREDQNMHVQRLGKGVYVVRPVSEDGSIQPLREIKLLQGLVN